jgi:ComF family protein
MVCIVCGRPTGSAWLCNNCRPPYEKAWVVGERDGTLQRLVGLYKFERARSAYKPLGDLLLNALPDLPVETVVIPVPTTPSRIRERGYDHMLLIAKHVARGRGLKCQQLVRRKTNTKQRQATAKKRDAQAKNAFFVQDEIDAGTPYLIVDDVMTTEATVKYAAQALRDAGARHVWVAIIARQTLD